MNIGELFFSVLKTLDYWLWTYICSTLILCAGLFYTFRSRGYQFKVLGNLYKNIKTIKNETNHGSAGVHPLRLFFASAGGMIGLGNIVSIVAAVTVGGPGSIFWLWVASLAGMLIKYCEIYLGITYRVKNAQGCYDGGPMYYLKAAFNNNLIPVIVCVLLCIYGVEVYQFTVITDSIVEAFGIDRLTTILILLILVLYVTLGGVRRVANICSTLVPIFMLSYTSVCLWVIGSHYAKLPDIFSTILKSAFNGHAAVGGFVGSSILLAIQYGTSRAVYSGDIGIGYDSIMQSETCVKDPKMQAHMAIYAVFMDTFVCTMTLLLIVVTDTWTLNLLPSQYVATALKPYIPYSEIFMLVLFFLTGFTTIISFFIVGIKCARYLSPKFGYWIYVLYASFAFVFFSFRDQTQVMLIMCVSGGLLMIFNVIGILKLRKIIKF